MLSPFRGIAGRSVRSLIAVRTYATVKKAASTVASGATQASGEAAAASPAKQLTNYGKEFRSQKVFLHHTYTQLLNNSRIMLICQHNNMAVPELIKLRADLAKAGGEMKVLRLGIFSAALRETRFANLEPLITGPTCLIHCNVTPEEEEAATYSKQPIGLKGIRQVVEKHSKMVLLGGAVDDALLSVEDVARVVDMPGIQTMRSQVVGVLSQAAGGRLVQLLQMNPQMLVLNLDAHAKSAEGNDNK
ncbi:hypothetical protein DFQ27_003695 [Actinomortierella ambigua]|uniref:Ribosomal protein L10 n=1 Tax=Actinomortierella ambigua TaxID=1343610 RepID=A0A9P6Q412_9FUNG|nr:hypothetical protein DFQ26_003554 [Actinomortierella ambigua]KAG0260146.1 hypothetical protein DFQ27_003695 [Actinomortierella ambigua]